MRSASSSLLRRPRCSVSGPDGAGVRDPCSARRARRHCPGPPAFAGGSDFVFVRPFACRRQSADRLDAGWLSPARSTAESNTVATLPCDEDVEHCGLGTMMRGICVQSHCLD